MTNSPGNRLWRKQLEQRRHNLRWVRSPLRPTEDHPARGRDHRSWRNPHPEWIVEVLVMEKGVIQADLPTKSWQTAPRQRFRRFVLVRQKSPARRQARASKPSG